MSKFVGKGRYASQTYPQPRASSVQYNALAFSTPQALAVFDASNLPSFAVVGVGVLDDSFRLIRAPSASLFAAVDGVNVIAAAAPSGAVWCRLYQRNLPAQYETSWFVDAVNGSDDNVGNSLASPLKTVRELSNRLRGARIAQNVTVTLAPGDYSADPVAFDLEIASGVSVSMRGDVTSIGDTLAAVTATVAGTAATNAGATRGAYQATSAAFTDRQRVRVTSGAASGAIAWVTAVTTPGAGGTAKTNRPGLISNPLTGTSVSLVNPSAGDTYALDTLNSTIGLIDIRVRGAGRFVIQDCVVSAPAVASHRGVCDNGTINGVMLYACRLSGAFGVNLIQGSAMTFANCQFYGTTTFAGCNIVVVRNPVFTGTDSTPAAIVTVQGTSCVQQNNCAAFDNAQLVIQQNSIWDAIGSGGTNDMQFVDNTQARAIEIAQGSTLWQHSSTNTTWGLDNAMSSVGVLIDAGGQFFYNQKPSVPGGAGSDFSVAGTTGLWTGAAYPVIRVTAGTTGLGAVLTS